MERFEVDVSLPKKGSFTVKEYRDGEYLELRLTGATRPLYVTMSDTRAGSKNGEEADRGIYIPTPDPSASAYENMLVDVAPDVLAGISEGGSVYMDIWGYDPETGRRHHLRSGELPKTPAIKSNVVPPVAGLELAELTFSVVHPGGVPEDAAIGTLVATAQGRTAGSTLTLPVSAGGRFAIDTGTGEIRVAAALDYETATSHDITVRETLAGASNSPRDTVLTIDVADVDETPAVTAPTASGALPDLMLTEGETMAPADLSADFTDGGGTLAFALAPSSGALPAGLSLSSVGVLSGTPTETVTDRSIIVRATNSAGSADSAFSLTVEAAAEPTVITQESPPVLATPTAGDTARSAYDAGTPGTYSATNGQTATISAIQMRSGGADVADSYILPAGAGLAVRETVTASDGTTETFESAAVTVQPAPNTDPVASPDTATVAAGGSVQIDVLANDSDADGDTLSVTDATATPAGTVTIGPAPDYLLTYNATGVPAGTDVTIFYTLSDGAETDSGTVTVTVEAVAPVLSNLQTSGSPVDTVTVDADRDCTVYWRLATASGQDAATVAGGGGEASGSFAATGSGGSASLDFASLAAGTYYLAVVAQSDGGPLSNVLEVEAILEEVGASVSFISSALVVNSSATASSRTSDPFFVGSGANRCLVAVIHGYLNNSANPPVINASFAGQPMTVAINEDNVPGQRVYSAIAYLVAPPSGSGTLTVDFFDSADGVTPVDNRAVAMHLVELNGVDQANPVPTTGSANVDNAGSVALLEPSLVTQFPGSMVISAMATDGWGVTNTEISVTGAAMLSGSPGQTGTAPFSDTTYAAARRLVSSAGAETHSYAWTTAIPAIAAIIEVKAA